MGHILYPRSGILKLDNDFILIFKKLLGKATKPAKGTICNDCLRMKHLFCRSKTKQTYCSSLRRIIKKANKNIFVCMQNNA